MGVTSLGGLGLSCVQRGGPCPLSPVPGVGWTWGDTFPGLARPGVTCPQGYLDMG